VNQLNDLLAVVRQILNLEFDPVVIYYDCDGDDGGDD
jgi:hypothetical protein